MDVCKAVVDLAGATLCRMVFFEFSNIFLIREEYDRRKKRELGFTV